MVMYRVALVALFVWFACSRPTIAEERGSEFPRRFAWGELVATRDAVELHVLNVPADHVVSVPRFNNPYRRIYLKSDAKRSPLEFRAEVKQWQVTLPKPVPAMPVIVIETVGAPQLLSRPFVSRANAEGGYVLPAHQAIVYGKKLRYEPQPHKNTIGFWLEEHDWCEWKLDVSAPGSFEVHVLQGCGKGHGGSKVEIRVGGSRVAFTVEDTGHFQNFKSRKVGILTVAAPGRQSLQIRPTHKAKVAVMDVRSVRLVPVQ